MNRRYRLDKNINRTPISIMFDCMKFYTIKYLNLIPVYTIYFLFKIYSLLLIPTLHSDILQVHSPA